MRGVKEVLVGVLLAASAHVLMAAPARAQLAVIDPANLAQSIMQVSHMVEQVTNQIQQIEQQTRMLARNPLQMSGDLTRSLGEARSLFNVASGLAFEADRLSGEIRTLYPETYAAHSLGEVGPRSQAWLEQSRLSLERAMLAEAGAAAAVGRASGRIDQALSASAGAEGQTSATQAGNQLLGVTATQLAEIHTLLAAQGRALSVERMERVAREQRALEVQRRAFPARRPVSPAPARSAF